MNVMRMIDLDLRKKDIPSYIQNVRAIREMGRDLSEGHVILCKVRFESAYIKRRERER